MQGTEVPVTRSVDSKPDALAEFEKLGGDLIACLIIKLLLQFRRLNQAQLVFQIVMGVLLPDQNLNPASLLLQLYTT
jgi:hypothetical protein